MSPLFYKQIKLYYFGLLLEKYSHKKSVKYLWCVLRLLLCSPLWSSIGCFMSELERLDGSFYLRWCCRDYSSACRIGSCLSQSDLTFECWSVLHRWPSCLLLLKAHRFECEGRRQNMLLGHESKPQYGLMFYQLLWSKMKANGVKLLALTFVLVEKLFLLRSSVCSL